MSKWRFYDGASDRTPSGTAPWWAASQARGCDHNLVALAKNPRAPEKVPQKQKDSF